MAAPEGIVARYRALPFGTDNQGDCAENDAKVRLLADLDLSANTEIAARLLLDVLSASDEYDLARIEAIKIVGMFVDAECPLERKLKRQLWRIVSDEHGDVLVRQYASQNIEAGFGGADEHRLVERLLFDDNEDVDVRHGALSYLETTPDVTFAQSLVPRLLQHDYWQRYDDALHRIAARADAQ